MNRFYCVAIGLAAAAATFQCDARAGAAIPSVTVVAEEDVYSYTNPNNGSGPLWSYGCTSIVRMGDEVFASEMQTGEGIPPLSNTRWRLRKRLDGSWPVVAEPAEYRQREPGSLARTADKLYLYANDSIAPLGTEYGPCVPHLLRFSANPGQSVPQAILPRWANRPTFTDHSYRGFASDRGRNELLMLNIDAETGIQHWCFLSATGRALGTGTVTFPVRACYPQVALVNGGGHILAVGDIVEPIEEWRKYKFEQTQRSWDYVFRILYYAWAEDLGKGEFHAPIEVANVDATAGHISNMDLWIAPTGEAYIMYSESEVASALMRDKFFPGKSTVPSLKLAVVKNGEIARRETLFVGTDQSTAGWARFQQTPDGRVYAVLSMTGTGARNKLMLVYPETDIETLVDIPLEKPLSSYYLATVRAGNEPSYTVDMLGQGGGAKISYAQFTIAAATP